MAPFSLSIRRSLLYLLGLVMSSALLVYVISSRRDPSFVPTSSNAGSLVAWAATIPEALWIWGIVVLAGALTIHLSLLLLAAPAAKRFLMYQGQSGIVTRLVTGVAGGVMGLGLGSLLWLGMLWYLLTQSIID